MFYLSISSRENNDPTNSFLSKTLRSSIPSPIPMNLTGTLSWSTIPMTTPPLAVPSSLVMASDVMSVALENYLACW